MKFTNLIRKLSRAVLAVAACLGIQVSAQTGNVPAGLLTTDHASVKAVMAVQRDLTPDMMKLPGVLGTAVGLDGSGQTALVIYIDRDAPTRADIVRILPPQLRGVGVQVELTEKFRAFGKPPGTPGGGNGGGGGGGGGGVSHTAKQTPPIQLGTSGGWRTDLANGYCCGGTLGSLIQVNGVQYILSNYHVFESDIVPGGNGIVATTGSSVIQPGLIDVGCIANNAQNVGTLVKVSSLPGNNVDCSVAQVIPDMVSGAILEIGTLSTTTVGASLNQAVKKSGRTTGLSSSTVSGLNATISVAYENECAGGAAFTKTFTGQIVIANSSSRFLNSGDSGSLMVENVTTNPRAVGLLYAGSSTVAIANPINDVLTFLGGKLGGTATMVGN
jgi:hypothetical protein